MNPLTNSILKAVIVAALAALLEYIAEKSQQEEKEVN